MLYEHITHDIIGCAMKVHSTLGSGFQELIYQRALAIEMRHNNIDFSREHEMKILYKGFEIGTRRVDFFVGNILVELKATTKIDELNLAHLMNYLEAYQLPIGLLINFGNKSLEFKRVYKSTRPLNKS